MKQLKWAGLVSGVVLLAAGCGIAGSGAPPAPSPTPSSSSVPGSSVASAADPSAGSVTDPGRLGDPVATRTATWHSSADDKNHKVEATFYPVRRNGSVSHVNIALRSTPGAQLPIDAMFERGDFHGALENPDAADGITLVDGKNQKVYLVAEDGERHCLCSRNLREAILDADPVIISATFAAPPTDVTTIDVRIPTFGTVTNVPIV